MVPCCGKLIFANLSVASALPCQFETVLGPSFNTANVFWVSAIETPYHYGFMEHRLEIVHGVKSLFMFASCGVQN